MKNISVHGVLKDVGTCDISVVMHQTGHDPDRESFDSSFDYTFQVDPGECGVTIYGTIPASGSLKFTIDGDVASCNPPTPKTYKVGAKGFFDIQTTTP